MDFWDLTKLLFRRWYFAAPVLVLTVVVSVYFQLSVKPDYIATGYIAVIPPAATPDTNTGTTVGGTQKPRNPWIDLGIDTLGTATIHTIEDKSVLESLKRAGLSTTFAITRDDYAPIYTIAVTGSSLAQATDSMHRLASLFNDTMTSLQQSYGAPADRMFTTRRLDLGDNVTTSNTKRKRALIAIVAVGVLFAAGTTIGVDAILRRRRRRRPVLEAPAVEIVPTLLGPQRVGRRLNGPASSQDDRFDRHPPAVPYEERPAAAKSSEEDPGNATVVMQLHDEKWSPEDTDKPTSQAWGTRR